MIERFGRSEITKAVPTERSSCTVIRPLTTVAAALVFLRGALAHLASEILFSIEESPVAWTLIAAAFAYSAVGLAAILGGAR